MTWLKLHNGLHVNEKILAAGRDADWLYVCGLCHCSQNLTDGRIPKSVVPMLSNRKNPLELAARLVKVGLWVDHPGYYEVNQYGEHQRSREQVESERGKARVRQAKARASRDSHSVTKTSVTAKSRVPDTDTDTETENGLPVKRDLPLSSNCEIVSSDALRAYAPTENIETLVEALAKKRRIT